MNDFLMLERLNGKPCVIRASNIEHIVEKELSETFILTNRGSFKVKNSADDIFELIKDCSL